ncbi:MAG TPA: hypothetical protein ENN75_02265 [candidate division Zixibacteria bacterium]|nr:hypothetical protein [candidate division Zixibacteria bacterium]
MKYLILAAMLFALITITGCPSEGSAPKSAVKIPESQVNRTHMETAASFATRICNKWNDGVFEPISPVAATSQLISALPPERQKSMFEEQILPEYGEFKRLFYKETYIANGNHIFRFRGDFEKGGPEVRVTITPMGLVGGFWIRPWNEELE